MHLCAAVRCPLVGLRYRAAMCDCDTNHVCAEVIDRTDSNTLVGFVEDRASSTASVYTDEVMAYKRIRHHHESIRHSVGEYVRGEVHTNSIESVWAPLKGVGTSKPSTRLARSTCTATSMNSPAATTCDHSIRMRSCAACLRGWWASG